jgi:hypothetical protein
MDLTFDQAREVSCKGLHGQSGKAIFSTIASVDVIDREQLILSPHERFLG